MACIGEPACTTIARILGPLLTPLLTLPACRRPGSARPGRGRRRGWGAEPRGAAAPGPPRQRCGANVGWGGGTGAGPDSGQVQIKRWTKPEQVAWEPQPATLALTPNCPLVSPILICSCNFGTQSRLLCGRYTPISRHVPHPQVLPGAEIYRIITLPSRLINYFGRPQIGNHYLGPKR
jgi:hypothetical protein